MTRPAHSSTTSPGNGLLAKLRRSFDRVFLAPMPLEAFDDYNDYWNKRPDPPLLHRYKQVAAALPEHGRVLDIGCGDGTFLAYLHSVKPQLDLYGLDISEVAIARLEARGMHGDVCDLTAEAPPPDLQADHVVMMEVLEHVVEAETLIRAVGRIGAERLYVTLPNMGHIEHRLRLALGGKTPVTAIVYHIKEHVRFWTVSDFKYWADQMGYRVVRCRGQNGTLFLWRLWPSLFAMQMTYILEKKGGSIDDQTSHA
ncbi:MAG: methyltransferase domain-containing protein [Lentisphaerae bacterium]|nr:methyltransferase domain-containing protein [Lentisphaerota bacterium]